MTADSAISPKQMERMFSVLFMEMNDQTSTSMQIHLRIVSHSLQAL